MSNQDEYKSVVGCDQMHIALITQDDAAGYIAETPVLFAPLTEVSGEPTTSLETQYANNQPFDIMASEAETKLTIQVTNIPNETLAKVLGKTFDTVSGRMYDSGGGAIPPDVALSFRAMKSNGKQIYYQYLKGKFSAPKDAATTRADKSDPKPREIEFTAVNTTHQFTVASGVTASVKRVVGDEDTTNFDGSTWFNQVQVPGVSNPAALALSVSDPASGATAVAVTKVLTLTFNNALLDGEEADAILINSTTGAIVAGTNILDSTRKIVTVGHTANLAAATLHRIVYTVKDIYGQTLSGVVSFTTA